MLEKLYDANNLIKAFNDTKKASMWKESTQRYEINLLKNIHKTQSDFKSGKYKQKEFYTFKINERGHERLIKSLHIYDRVIQRSLCDNILVPKLKKYLIYDNGASLKNKGIDFTRKRFDMHLQKYIRKHGAEGYILQIDFKKFFDNIPHRQLTDAIREKINDCDVMELVKYIVNTFKIDVSYLNDKEFKECYNNVYNSLEHKESNEGIKYMHKSLGIGSQISQISGIFYPTLIDNYCKIVRQQKYYGRYMDDIYIINNSKDELKNILEEIENISKDMCLFINHKKTHITKLKHGFTFLKTRYIITDSGKIIKKIPRDTITRERRKLKKFKRLLSKNKITLKEIKDQYKSWKNNFKKFNCYKTIKSMDKLFNDLYKDKNN